MRPLRHALVILGLFQALVTWAEPYGTTDVTVFDTDFLSAPAGPAPEPPVEPQVPEWVAVAVDDTPPPLLPPIPLPELPS